MFANEAAAMNHYSIKDIESITGIKSHTIRIWEQRYKILVPQRTSTNIRYYSEEDLRTILNVNVLYRSGLKISKIANLNEEEIRNLVKEASEKLVDQDIQIQGMVTAMLNLDEESFETIIQHSFDHIGVEFTTEKLIFPFLNHIGYLWQVGTIDPAFEHFISQIIRRKLVIVTSNLGSIPPHKDEKRFILFLPAGEPHEIGLLLANYAIRKAGHKSLYLGADLPHTDLKQVVDKFKPHYIFCSSTCGSTYAPIEEITDYLGKEFQNSTILFTGYSFHNSELKLPDNSRLISSNQDLQILLD